MKLGWNARRALRYGAALAAVLMVTTAYAAETYNWVGSWAASPQPIWGADFYFPVGIPRALRDQTVRQVARLSLGAHRIRVVLSNEYGATSLHIGAAQVALIGENGAVKAGDGKVLTFGGQPQATVPPGAPMTSDPVDLDVAPLGSVAVSLYFPDITPITTWHFRALQTTTIADGNVVADAELKAKQTAPSRVFLSEILVDAPMGTRAVVPFGDSITDGAASTLDANHRWPDFLAERLNAAGANIAVVNESISGDRILRDRMGDNALARFDRDVLSQPNADTVVLMMGINDIGWPDSILVPKGEPAPSADDVIIGYKQLISRAHDHNMRIIGATLTPFNDAFAGLPPHGFYSPEKETKRQAINAFIRGGAFDGVIDFDAVVRNPAKPTETQAAYDSGDHLHPNDAGYKAMADSIDLSVLGVKK
jgi:lysophospholipase L1-like esterase